MRFLTLAPLIAAALAAVGVTGRSAAADPAARVSGPHVHENLAVYFVHGRSADGPTPLTLQEALLNGKVSVIETGRVNELMIENAGADPVFIQAGDIVKGGKQDRVLTVSFILPPNSGRLPIASFCVEQGRWSARGAEEVAKFSSAGEAMPSRAALLAMAAPPPAAKAPSDPPTATAEPSTDVRNRVQQREAAGRARNSDETSTKQRKVWDSVANTQQKLSQGLNAAVAAPQSASSLQLSLENGKLKEARTAYIKALEQAGVQETDVVGYVVAINGKISVANVYPSNALFKKMWGKQLAAVVTEAIGEKAGAQAAPAPPRTAASEFLTQAEQGTSHERAVAAGVRQETRDAEKSLFSEARAADGKWIHRAYMAK